jgi:hypothetical protein
MTRVPDRPKVFHITHVENLPGIMQAGCLWSDAKRIELGLACELVGMAGIKARRLHELAVKCHPSTKVGEYVPFYFCPRSIMLYILHMGNHPELTYRAGQGPLVHLVADLMATIEWATGHLRRWAFSNRNAGTFYADFYKDPSDLDRLNWDAIQTSDFSSPDVKDGKQAEFLLHESFPWELIERVGVRDSTVADRVRKVLGGGSRQPEVRVQADWYF